MVRPSVDGSYRGAEGHRGRAVEPEASAASCSNFGRSLRISGCGCRSRQYECFRRRFGAFRGCDGYDRDALHGNDGRHSGSHAKGSFHDRDRYRGSSDRYRALPYRRFPRSVGSGSHFGLDFCAAYCFRIGWHHQRDQPDRRRGRAFVGLLHSCVRAVRGIVLPFGRQ